MACKIFGVFKIKIKNIEDNTAEEVDILITLPKGISPNKTIDALYLFTQCEISISPNCCVIKENKPVFSNINDMLVDSTWQTQDLLQKELEFRHQLSTAQSILQCHKELQQMWE